MNWSQLLESISGDSAFQDLQLPKVLVNLALVLLLGQILAWHYVRYSRVLSNKRKFARMFVFIGATTMLVISVVQTSLALSLGLVGALSIIRFRTPIKEPEELAYLFLSVGLGVGMGAGEHVITTLIVCVTLLYLALTATRGKSAIPARVLVHVSCELEDSSQATADGVLATLLRETGLVSKTTDLRRLDVQERAFHANLVLDSLDPKQIGAMLQRIQTCLPRASVSLVEGSSLD
jgi:hypothetical protein